MDLVLDTNVLVSALLSPFGAPGRVLDLVFSGACRVAFDDRIMAEYRDVLVRPKFPFEPRSVDDLLTYLATTGAIIAAPVLRIALPDPNDVMLIEVAAGAQAPLITGNRKHFPIDQCAGVLVLTPSEFIAWWQRESRV
jgi:putative PIN family toxin of toxin-antitoxin system